MYLSYVTLTTVGFGDLTPYTNLARSVVVLEALIGQIFLVTLVARLVALYSSEHSTPANLGSSARAVVGRRGDRRGGRRPGRAARVGGQVHPRRGRPGPGPLDGLRRGRKPLASEPGDGAVAPWGPRRRSRATGGPRCAMGLN